MSIYRLVVDQDRCIACHACEASCKAAHDSAPGISLGTLLVDGPRFEDAVEEATPIIVKHARPEAPAPLAADGEPRVVLHTRYRACVQCPQPRCVEVCPKEALIRRESDGIVFIREEACVGCRGVPESLPASPDLGLIPAKGNPSNAINAKTASMPGWIPPASPSAPQAH